VTGGIAFGFSTYLNGAFIGSYLGAPGVGTGELELSFDNATIYSDRDNVLLVMQDNHGHDEVAAATLLGSQTGFEYWKVTGTAGGDDAAPLDPVRRPLNENGLTAERLG